MAPVRFAAGDEAKLRRVEEFYDAAESWSLTCSFVADYFKLLLISFVPSDITHDHLYSLLQMFRKDDIGFL